MEPLITVYYIAPGKPVQNGLVESSTAACATSCSTRACGSTSMAPARASPNGARRTRTPRAPVRRRQLTPPISPQQATGYANPTNAAGQILRAPPNEHINRRGSQSQPDENSGEGQQGYGFPAPPPGGTSPQHPSWSTAPVPRTEGGVLPARDSDYRAGPPLAAPVTVGSKLSLTTFIAMHRSSRNALFSETSTCSKPASSR